MKSTMNRYDMIMPTRPSTFDIQRLLPNLRWRRWLSNVEIPYPKSRFAIKSLNSIANRNTEGIGRKDLPTSSNDIPPHPKGSLGRPCKIGFIKILRTITLKDYLASGRRSVKLERLDAAAPRRSRLHTDAHLVDHDVASRRPLVLKGNLKDPIAHERPAADLLLAGGRRQDCWGTAPRCGSMRQFTLIKRNRPTSMMRNGAPITMINILLYDDDETSLLVLHFKAVRIRERVGRRWRVREGNGRHFDSVVEGMQSGGETSAETWKLSWEFANDFVVKVRTNGFHGSGKEFQAPFHERRCCTV
ncbi:unnamed protein product [Nesidiocoris tenuis]|uniref:Uncharacterized protein n=1 Tax=Nesidiocoris tenuis TaxID=355587 RepID=A0A6H5G8D8_9HEMI|nr:unnamed protein product [Nesidiocoris tenuis]